MVRLLLSAQPTAVSISDHTFFTPLHHAAMGESAEVAALLYAATPTEERREPAFDDNDVLHLALGAGETVYAHRLSVERTQMALAFLQDAPEAAALENTQRQLPLHLAALAHASLPLVDELIRAYPEAACYRDGGRIRGNLVTPGYLPIH